MHIESIPLIRLKSIRLLVPYDEYLELKSGRASAIAAFADDAREGESPLTAIGALVYAQSPYSEISQISEILISSIYVKEEFRCRGIGSKLVKYLEESIAVKAYKTGISINFIMPEQSRAAGLFMRNGYNHRVDGNRIYNIPTIEIFKEPEVKKLIDVADKCRIISFEQASNTLLNELYGRFGKEIPGYLAPDTYGGVLQKDLSFLTVDKDRISFLAASLYPMGELFLGGLYVSNHNGFTVAALLGKLIKKLADRDDINSVLLSAANDTSDKIVHRIFRQPEAINDCQIVTNYYKEMIGGK